MPPNRKDLIIQRILVRNGVSRDLGEPSAGRHLPFACAFRKASPFAALTETEAGATTTTKAEAGAYRVLEFESRVGGH
jgi:hypothetical protein